MAELKIEPQRQPTKEEKDLWVAEAEKARQEARKFAAEADKAEHEARVAQLATIKAERTETEELATDKYHHIYYFTESVSSSSVQRCIDRLTYWQRLDSLTPDKPCDMQIVFNSPGGSVIDGMVLFDYLQILRKQGHRITTSTLGMAASMAGILLQAGAHRVVHKEAWMLIHEVQFGASGSMGAVEDTVEWVKRIQERVLTIFSDRCKTAGEAGTAKHPLTKVQLKKRWTRKDWWIDSASAVDWGLADEVR